MPLKKQQKKKKAAMIWAGVLELDGMMLIHITQRKPKPPKKKAT